jgi:hypothetical protein
MKDLKCLSLPELVDLLSEYTITYMKLFSERARSDEFYEVMERIQDVQKEIKTRMKDTGLKTG